MKKLVGADEHLELLRSVEGELKQLGDDYSVPLVARQPEGFPRPVGTGWFFRCELEWFLVTAAHVVEEFFPVGDRKKTKPSDSMLLVPGVDAAMVPLGGKWSLSDDYDVAILRLESPSVVRDRWKPVTMADLAPDEPEDQYPWYHVTGWPTEYSKRVEGGLAGDKFRFNAQAEPVPAGDEFDRKMRIRFPLYRNDFGTIDGNEASHPQLRGISGAPVWRIFEDGNRYRPLLAGVQVSYWDRHTVWYIDAVRWGCVRMLIEHSVPGLFKSAEKLVLR
ncbi:trypsin-like serine protease [Myxococcus qinghaiensis]|uniref:trypsin-like serine protease n=1 Tax=Myxococcus qinghaiensis TaxID=2906758 RepID=UPI0020A7869B|nr:trypsin-like serine protease [Myxococcus qinghaiensis]MCP3169939.1 S1 family peptidase [Myxococcus qinghaiensis]